MPVFDVTICFQHRLITPGWILVSPLHRAKCGTFFGTTRQDPVGNSWLRKDQTFLPSPSPMSPIEQLYFLDEVIREVLPVSAALPPE